MDPAWHPSKVVAIDSNGQALDNFRSEAKIKWSGVEVDFIPKPFETVQVKGDVVYFEFCLHQMDDPVKSLQLARSLAGDIVVMDHLPGSEWMFIAAEENLVVRSREAIEKFGVRRQETQRIDQKFEDHAQLSGRLSGQGPESEKRIARFKDVKGISIRMDYGLFLL